MSIRRNCDRLGRICLPSEMRNQLGIDVNSSVEIDIRDGSYLIIKPTSIDMTTKVKSKIEVFQNRLNENVNENERVKIQYVLNELEDLL